MQQLRLFFLRLFLLGLLIVPASAAAQQNKPPRSKDFLNKLKNSIKRVSNEKDNKKNSPATAAVDTTKKNDKEQPDMLPKKENKPLKAKQKENPVAIGTTPTTKKNNASKDTALKKNEQQPKDLKQVTSKTNSKKDSSQKNNLLKKSNADEKTSLLANAVKENKKEKNKREKQEKDELKKRKQQEKKKNKKGKDDKNKKNKANKKDSAIVALKGGKKKNAAGNNSKKSHPAKKGISVAEAIKSTNKLLELRGTSRYNAMKQSKAKDAYNIEQSLDNKTDNSENRIFDLSRKLSSNKSVVSKTYSPFAGGSELQKKQISLFIDAAIGLNIPLDPFQDRLQIQNPQIGLTQLSRVFIPIKIGFGVYSRSRYFSGHINYSYNYGFGSQTFRSERLGALGTATRNNNVLNTIGYTEAPVTDIHEITLNGHWYFYQKITEGVDLIKFYTGIETGIALLNVASKYTLTNADVLGSSFSAEFKKQYPTIFYLKNSLKLGVLYRVNRDIHLFSDVAFSYYLPLKKKVPYTLTSPNITFDDVQDRILSNPDYKKLLGKDNWQQPFKNSLQIGWQIGIRYVLPN